MVLGAIVGSFLATVAARWPRGESVIAGRSRCDHCGEAVRARDLVPLLSYLVLRGRCRACHGRIEPDHFGIELIAALIGGAAFAVAPGWPGAAGATFGWLLLTLAALDLRHYWLPDRLTLLMAATGLVAGLAGLAPPLESRLIGLAAGFAGLWLVATGYRLLRQREGLGGGDPKLFGAIGAWLGWEALPPVLLGATIVGLLWVLARLIQRQPVGADDRLPFGALLAFAAFPIWIVLQ